MNRPPSHLNPETAPDWLGHSYGKVPLVPEPAPEQTGSGTPTPPASYLSGGVEKKTSYIDGGVPPVQ